MLKWNKYSTKSINIPWFLHRKQQNLLFFKTFGYVRSVQTQAKQQILLFWVSGTTNLTVCYAFGGFSGSLRKLGNFWVPS